MKEIYNTEFYGKKVRIRLSEGEQGEFLIVEKYFEDLELWGGLQWDHGGGVGRMAMEEYILLCQELYDVPPLTKWIYR